MTKIILFQFKKVNVCNEFINKYPNIININIDFERAQIQFHNKN